ncbi:quinol monooxygenase YgiN [Hydrogenophaga palleronii]|uniref:Quinol monooxygenase YgiN n=1 Tax=Hydrogenophaga palleronii TaxID=65655 RepID=A0ABU1WPU6_9BURK|nr:NIPSNAP family protein [Hydrogenophaga palleronii]MDR7151317.1 quinol monooxygenase YgiN [Hydrogenophaga palleronii]
MISTHTPLHLDCHVVELRQYTLHPGQRDTLIKLFEREFLETQEATGMTVMGQFRDLDNDDRFVWLRGFSDMTTRQAALDAFYGGPVWAAHRDAANATMVDSDNVLLLRPAWDGASFPLAQRPAGTANPPPAGMLDASIFHLHQPASSALVDLCRHKLTPLLRQTGASAVGWYVSETAANNFPRLPVREGEHVMVGLALFESAQALEDLVRSGVWAREAQHLLDPHLLRPTESLRLAPTARSAIRL